MADYNAGGEPRYIINTIKNIKIKKSRIYIYLHNITKYKSNNFMTEIIFFFLPGHNPQ